MGSSRRFPLGLAAALGALVLAPAVVERALSSPPPAPSPIGKSPGFVAGPTLPPAIKPAVPTLPPQPFIEDFSLMPGVRDCSDPDNRRPILRYRVRGPVRFVQITRKLTSREVTDGPHLWSSGGPLAPAHSESGIVDEGATNYAARLEAYVLEAGSPSVFRTLPFRYRPPMSLRLPGGAVKKTILPAGRIQYEIRAEYQGLADVNVQIVYATPVAGRKDEPSATGKLDPYVGDPRNPSFGTRFSGRIVWVVDWPPHSEERIRAPKRYTFTGRQTGPCGVRTTPPQGPISGD